MAKTLPSTAVLLASFLLVAGYSESGASETSAAAKSSETLSFASQEAPSSVASAHSHMSQFQRFISGLAEEWKSLIRRKARVTQSTAAASVQWPAWRVARDISPESNQQFLADNAKAAGVVVLPDGLQYRIIKKGDGKTPTPEDLVTVTYRASLIDGTVFAGTKPGETATFPTGQLIEGWVEALLVMKEGGEWRLFVPANLGYGEEGNGQAVPPNQTLVFDIQLLTVGRPSIADASHPEQTARVQ